MNTFDAIIQKYRDSAFSERDKGGRFERLMQAFLKTYPLYNNEFRTVWLWSEFPSRGDLGGKDTGIDLVIRTNDGDYWAVQCKCYQEDASIDKPHVDSFLSTSGRSFFDVDEPGKKVNFAYRLWIDTTRTGFNHEAENTIQNQNPPVGRIGYYDLVDAPVDWEKLEAGITGGQAVKRKYSLKPHQQEAIDAAHRHYEIHDRGKLIMACGTGKTYTSLCIAENETGGTGIILFLVPSIALLGQTLREWTSQAAGPLYPICICSDAGVSKSKEDVPSASLIDLALPASTNIENIIRQYERARLNQQKDGGLVVVFSTYQSIDVIAAVQKTINRQSGDCVFDLIICDEAHRTTGVTLAGEDESAFVKVHDDAFLRSKKRMYMTATPRLYSEATKGKAKEAEAELCSMDDCALYGEEMYRIGFGEAVDKQLLSDYKVIVLTIDESQLSDRLKKNIKERTEEIDAEAALKIIGCINALSKKSLTDREIFKDVDPAPMRSAVSFCQNIRISKATAEAFNACREAYFETLTEAERREIVIVAAAHVDGTMGAQKREQKLQWLKSADAEKRECHILNNVRCLSEGVDVPSLDAVLFLSARNSQIDVVQSVGRVMRTAPGKKYGYIIIPVIIPPDEEPEKILDSSERFKVVWTVLNALRAHDDRFNAVINKIELNKKKPNTISVTGVALGGEGPGSDEEDGAAGKDRKDTVKSEFRKQLELKFAEFQGIVYAKMVQKCGSRRYWEQWAADVAKIAERHIKNINAIIAENGTAKDEFERYLSDLRKNINPSVTERDAVEMLAQHIITQPVFDALFEDYSFVKNNAVSQSLQRIIGILNEQTDKADREKLERFYVSVQERAKGIDNSEAKQKIIVELYDKFFRTAFPAVTEKLGIVYTPVEIVDFIIRSVEDLLQKEFSRSMSDENVHILDPFTGTGTFITRLLQSGIIKPQDLERKYKKEIHANEIVLLAYYIASINIENVYHDVFKAAEPYNEIVYPDTEMYVADSAETINFPSKNKSKQKASEYAPFPGICLTDTFQLGERTEEENLFSEIFPQNSERVREQKKMPLRIIIGNPPYSVGQKSANDNAQNQHYPKLEERIAKTYVKNSKATLNKSVYDSYVKAFRWASDRLDPNGGIIGFVSNGSWLDSSGLDGFRKNIEQEFSSIYVYNLRGNQRTSGELSRKEGGKIFGSGSRTPVSITILVKNPNAKSGGAQIFYRDIGDYLSREEKLALVKERSSILNPKLNMTRLKPDKHGDWLNKRNDLFSNLIPLEPDKKFDSTTQSFFSTYSLGIVTSKDAWLYNFSNKNLSINISKMVSFYNEQRIKYHKEGNNKTVKDFVLFDTKKITWTDMFLEDIKNNIPYAFDDEKICYSLYRPYVKLYFCYEKQFIQRTYQQTRLFPTTDAYNILICVSGIGSAKSFSIIITDKIPCLDLVDKSQCFPLYWYEKKKNTGRFI